jgi:tRNA-modifying protein YgfZ
MSSAILLADRGVIEISGEEAVKFLHNIVTNEVMSIEPGSARYAALLAPQGKILSDFLIFATGAGADRKLLIDCPRDLAADVKKRLGMYKLRAKVEIVDVSDDYESFAFPDAQAAPAVDATALAPDPRSATLGWRALAKKGAIVATTQEDAYESARIAARVPRGGVDFLYNDAFPQEANMDLLAGVDYKKGCYIGQEVVSRMKHRGTSRKRIAPYVAEGEAPAPGAKIMLGDVEIGTVGSHAGAHGLALVRLDRLADGKAAGKIPQADGVALTFDEPPAAG